jgi:hypothetical protein
MRIIFSISYFSFLASLVSTMISSFRVTGYQWSRSISVITSRLFVKDNFAQKSRVLSPINSGDKVRIASRLYCEVDICNEQLTKRTQLYIVHKPFFFLS